MIYLPAGAGASAGADTGAGAGAGNTTTTRTHQFYSSIPPRRRQPPTLTAQSRSASGPTIPIPFSPPILDLVLDQHTNYFMDSGLPNSGDSEIPQSFSADAATAAVGEDNLFINTLSIDTNTKLSLNPRRRKRTSPVTPISHAHVFSTQYSQSFTASQETPTHSRVPSSSNPQLPSVFHAFGQLPVDVGQLSLSPTLVRSHSHRPQRSRSRSPSQNLQPLSQAGSSRNPSPRLSISSAPARTTTTTTTNSHNSQATETTDPPPKKKRRRQALSCTECKRRKIRCDRVQPCAPCKKRGEGDKCRWHILEPVCVNLILLSVIKPPISILASSSSVPETSMLVLTRLVCIYRDKFVTRKEYDEIKDSLTRLQSLLPIASSNSLNSEAGFGSEGATYQSVSVPTCSTAPSQRKVVNNITGTRTSTDIGTGLETRSMDDPLPSRGPDSRHQLPVSYHTNAPHAHRGPPPSSYNPITIAPPTPFTLPSLLQTSSSTAVPLLPPPFPSHPTMQRPPPRQPAHFQSDSDQASSLPSLGQRIPSHFIQASPLQSISNSQSSAGSFTSPPFAPPDTTQVYQPDTWDQLTSSAGLDPSFQSDECHRDVSVSIDIDMNDMNGSHSHSHSTFHDRGNTREGGVWNPDGRVRPLSPRNDVSHGGDARYEPQPPGTGGQVGGGVRFDNYRLDQHQRQHQHQHQHQLCGSPPLDATEAIAKAMAAQRGDFVVRPDLAGVYKMLPPPPLPTFNLPNIHLQSRQEESGSGSMTAGSRDNLPTPLSCAAAATTAVAAAPVHATTARTHWPQLSLRSPHTPDAAESPVNTLVPPRLPLEGHAAKEAEMKRTMRICLPRKEVCDHLVEHYVSLLRSFQSSVFSLQA